MSEALQQPDRVKVSSNRSAAWITIIGTLGANVLRHGEIVPFPYEYMVSYTVAFLIGYWIPPKPAQSFRHYAGRTLSIVSILHAGLWAAPQMLNRFLWTPLAYGLPAFALMIWAYWVKPLDPTNTKQNKFWVHLLIAAALAIVYTWVIVKSLHNHY